MRLVILAQNARSGDAIGTQIAAKVQAARLAGWSIRLYLEDETFLHPDVADCTLRGSADDFWEDDVKRAELESADAVLVEFGGAFGLLHLLPALAGTGPRIVFTYYGVTPRDLWEPNDRPRMAAAEAARRYVWCADAVIVTSAYLADELACATGFPKERMTTLPCAVPLADAAVPLAQAPASERATVLYVGRLAVNKRVAALVKAIARLRDQGRDVGLRLIGPQDGVFADEANRCRDLARTLGIASAVRFDGTVDETELRTAYRTAAAVVLPSLHEGFGMPCVEAMAAGAPVLAARAAALPETVGPAGLMFTPDDEDDLARQLARVLFTPAQHPPRRPTKVAVVAPRFGTDFAGGAEASLRRMALALQATGIDVEVFSTCNRHDSRWGNHFPAGSSRDEGLLVQRFPIDPVDQHLLGECYQTICRKQGLVDPSVEQTYVRHSLQSSALLDALKARGDEYAAILVGPYLFALSYQVAKAFGEKVLLAPCFHDEPLARLAAWRDVYGAIGGMLYHTATEQHFAEAHLHLNHPNSTVVGTLLPPGSPGDAQRGRRRAGGHDYVVYCGRYCPEKGLPELLEWFAAYAAKHPGGPRLVCVGHGALPLPKAPWLVDLGFVSETDKQDLLAGALGLVLLSRNESLSIVVLESWRAGRPVIGHQTCAVVRDQIARAGGGVVVASAPEFHAALDRWRSEPEQAARQGRAGQQFVREHYQNRDAYTEALHRAITNLQRPVRALVIENGSTRAAAFGFAAWCPRWQKLLVELVRGPVNVRRPSAQVRIVPPQVNAPLHAGQRLVSLRVTNTGGVALPGRGPAAWVVRARVRDACGQPLAPARETALPELLIPGETAVVVATLALPATPCAGHAEFRVEPHAAPGTGAAATVAFTVAEEIAMNQHPAEALLAEARRLLADLPSPAALPTDYCDVTTGLGAPLKRWVKQKLLNNFRRAYVDVLARQQTEFNQRVLALLGCVMDGMAALTAPGSGTAPAGTDRVQDNGNLHAQLVRLRQARRRDRQRLRRLEARLRRLERRENSLKEAAA
jgi:glycosyltransferase involved in cell wall biosynthesis